MHKSDNFREFLAYVRADRARLTRLILVITLPIALAALFGLAMYWGLGRERRLLDSVTMPMAEFRCPACDAVTRALVDEEDLARIGTGRAP